MAKPLFKKQASSDFKHFTDELVAAIWNRIAVLPQFRDLQPRDFPALYESIQHVLKRYAKTFKRTSTLVFLLVLAGCSVPVLAADAASSRLVLSPESRVWLTGSSTLHPYASTSTLTQVAADLILPAPTAFEDVARRAPFQHFEVIIPVKGLKSGESGLDKNMYKALKSAQAAEIRFVMTHYKTLSPATGSPFPFQATGQLSIAGTQKDISLNGTARPGTGDLVIDGEYPLRMSDYGIKPPTLLLGAIKVADPVLIHFHLVFTLTKGAQP